MTAVAVMAAVGAFALEPVKLNEPDLDRGGSLMRALADRRSVREYADRALSLQDMSDLLWAANGVNRPASGKRTAPSAMDRRDIQIYVLTDKGVYLYVPEQSLLQPVAEGDHRQDVRGNKPAVNLVLVAEDGSSRRYRCGICVSEYLPRLYVAGARHRIVRLDGRTRLPQGVSAERQAAHHPLSSGRLPQITCAAACPGAAGTNGRRDAVGASRRQGCRFRSPVIPGGRSAHFAFCRFRYMTKAVPFMIRPLS